MGRRTTPSVYRSLAETALETIPDLALTTDIMVGFPGENEREFAASMDFVHQIGFSRLHVFAFSPRPGTAAAAMADQVPRPVIQERSRRMRKLAVSKQNEFLKRFLGREMPVLWESQVGEESGSALWRGHTDNYITVTATSCRSLRNKILPTLLHQVLPGGMKGQILPEKQYTA
jgi:threonylcarbamoyladenosine tRNA methylthiotransferase MtaB